MSSIDSPYVIKKMNIKKLVHIGVSVIVAATIWIMVFWIISIEQSRVDFQNSVPTEYSEEIEVLD